LSINISKQKGISCLVCDPSCTKQVHCAETARKQKDNHLTLSCGDTAHLVQTKTGICCKSFMSEICFALRSKILRSYSILLLRKNICLAYSRFFFFDLRNPESCPPFLQTFRGQQIFHKHRK
jgi:hypothetical protein